jgi:hypothetical protein
MPQLENDSPVGRLLDEISWEGTARPYRGGGRGKENVLTVETFTPLDYLPRTRFLGQMIRCAHGADEARARVAEEIEQAEISLLPGDVLLGQTGVHVQPDATIITPNAYVLVEAKRIRPSSFEENQLARELVAAIQEARDRTPLLMLVLGDSPPVKVRGVSERVEIATAISARLSSVAARTDLSLTDDELVERIPEVTAWITWSEIREVVVHGGRQLHVESELAGTLRRLCEATITAIDWHT